MNPALGIYKIKAVDGEYRYLGIPSDVLEQLDEIPKNLVLKLLGVFNDSGMSFAHYIHSKMIILGDPDNICGFVSSESDTGSLSLFFVSDLHPNLAAHIAVLVCQNIEAHHVITPDFYVNPFLVKMDNKEVIALTLVEEKDFNLLDEEQFTSGTLPN